jgi:hypothetical protein
MSKNGESGGRRAGLDAVCRGVRISRRGESSFALGVHFQGQVLPAIGIHGEPPVRFAILRAGLDETQPAEMIANQTILAVGM